MSKLLSVHSLIAYLTQEGMTRRQEDWDAYKIIQALKGETINGYFDLKIGGETKRFTQANVGTFLPVLFRAVAKKLTQEVKGQFDLVPIPNSSASVKSGGASFATLNHAKAIAAALESPQGTPNAALLWKQPKTPAHRGGSRDPQVHCANLKVVQKITRPVVIFDDVTTTGSQMIAAHRMLAGAGAKVLCGIVIGRATHEYLTTTIKWREEQFETSS